MSEIINKKFKILFTGDILRQFDSVAYTVIIFGMIYVFVMGKLSILKCTGKNTIHEYKLTTSLKYHPSSFYSNINATSPSFTI